ncbi:B12-binding domain-containing radical SAM protein [Candidatus Omnitrophota bacterium]
MSLKITIIRPPVYSVGLMGAHRVPVLGVVYIAASLRAAGQAVDIVDMLGEDIERTEIVDEKYVQYGMSLASIEGRIENKDVVIFSCMFSQDWPFHRQLIEKVRSFLPHAILVAGGEHVSALPEFCLADCAALDVSAVGEGERVSVELMHAIEQGNSFEGVDGLVYRDATTSRIVKSDQAKRIKEIDAIPWPAWDLIPLDNYLDRGLNSHITRGRTIPMLATRGCPYECDFCSNKNMWHRCWLPRDPKDVVREMKQYMQRYMIDNFIFSDLTVVIQKTKILAFCHEIQAAGLHCTWQLPTLRTEVVDREVLEAMYAAGCRELDFSVESGSPEVLKAVKKKNDPKRMLSLISQAKDVGFNLSINIVIGLPQERLSDFCRSFGFVMKAAFCGLDEINVFPFIPYPGSHLFETLLKNKRIELNDDYFKRLFGYANLSQPVSFSTHFGPRTIMSLRFFLLGCFYGVMLLTHPARIIGLFKSLRSGKATTKLENVLNRIISNIKFSNNKRKAK